MLFVFIFPLISLVLFRIFPLTSEDNHPTIHVLQLIQFRVELEDPELEPSL